MGRVTRSSARKVTTEGTPFSKEIPVKKVVKAKTTKKKKEKAPPKAVAKAPAAKKGQTIVTVEACKQ
jgi:hypothetical protein